MAVWEVRLVYRNGDRFWENVWHVDVGTATDVPSGLLDAFQSFGLNTLRDVYTLSKIVRRPAGTTDAFIEFIIEAAGLVTTTGSKTLPLWNTVRMLLQGGAGRPGVKFLRGYLVDLDLADDQNHIISSAVSNLQDLADALFNAASDASCTFVFGAANHAAVSPVIQSLIQMRQQHRKRKKTV